jgi:hypothetical protein
MTPDQAERLIVVLKEIRDLIKSIIVVDEQEEPKCGAV